MTKTAEHAQSHRFFPEVEHFRNIARLHRLPTGFPECLGALPLRVSQDHTLRSSFTELFRRMQQTYSDFTVNDATWMLLTAIGGHTAANRQVAPEGVIDFVISFVTSIGGWPEARRAARAAEPHRTADPQRTAEPLHYPAVAQPPSNFYDAPRSNELSTRWNQPAPGGHYDAAPPRNEALEQITQTLARLERSTGDLRLYLDSVDQRLSRLEPLLENHHPQPPAPEPQPHPVAPQAASLVHRPDDPPAIPPTPQPPPSEPPAPAARATPRPRFAAAMDLPQTNSTFAAPFQHHSPPLRPAAPAQPPRPSSPPEPRAIAPALAASESQPMPEPQPTPELPARSAPSAADNIPQSSAPSAFQPTPGALPPEQASQAPNSVLSELNRSSAPLPSAPSPSATPSPAAPEVPPLQARNPEPALPRPSAPEPPIPHLRGQEQQGLAPRMAAPQTPATPAWDPQAGAPQIPVPSHPTPRIPEPYVPEQRLSKERSATAYDQPPAPNRSFETERAAPLFNPSSPAPQNAAPFTQRAPVAPGAPLRPPQPDPHPAVAQATPPLRTAMDPFGSPQDTQPQLSGRPLPPPPTFGTDLFGQHSPEDHDDPPKRSRTPLILGLFAALLVALALAVLARGRPLPSWTRIAPASTSKPPASQQDDPNQAPSDSTVAPSSTDSPHRGSADPLSPGKVLGARTEESPQANEQILHSLPYVPELTLRSRLVSGSPALYPRSPNGDAVRGTVVLQVIVRPDGTVGTVNVLGGPKSLRDAAINAVRRWQFQPTLVHGVPAQIRSTLHIPVEPPDQQ